NFFVEENTPPQKAKIIHGFKLIVKIATTISDYELASPITRFGFKFISFVDLPSKDSSYAIGQFKMFIDVY
ncbi:hypothetical protein, partial [Winogradskyella ouciana]|uniref:hypothetical protein n=1 Tax=Winogradskyella ouciana TaxID=2608631 RepID=UPI001F17560B